MADSGIFTPVRFRLSNPVGGSPFTVDTNPYLANDNVGGLGRVYYGNALKGGLVMRGMSLRDISGQDIPYDVHLYRSAPGGETPLLDNAPFTPTVEYADLEIGIITIEAGLYKTANGGAYSKAYKEVTHIDIDNVSAGQFFVYMEPLVGVTYAALDLLPEFVFWSE